jgi:serine/threonine-protein kinase
LFVLKAPAFVASREAAGGVRVAARSSTWRRVATAAGALVVGCLLTGTIVWLATRPTVLSPRVSRLQIMPPSAAALEINNLDRDLTITPDGSRIVYIGGTGGTTLFVRALDQLDATPLARIGGPRSPFVSPDGQWVGFIDGSAVLKKISITGGPAVTVGQLNGTSRGATWSPDGSIIIASSSATTGLLRIGPAGGEPTVLTRPDRARGEADHLWPRILPGGQAVLFTITATTGGLDAASVAVLDLGTGTQTTLVRGGTDAHYVASGHLVYGAGGSLRAMAFDLAKLAVVGPPVQVLPQVLTGQFGSVDVAVANDGTLVYVPGRMSSTQRTLVWVDRQGQETPIAAAARAYTYPRVSPDGTRIAVFSADQDNDIWLWDVVRATLTPVTFDPGLDTFPVWRADGRRLFFASERAGARNLFGQAADGTGALERLTESPNSQNPTAISPDSTRLVFTGLTTSTGEDVMALQLEGAHKVMALVQTPSAERNGIISPDGRWLAYEANDSGQLEIYVRPFPEVTGGHWQVSTAGGTRPLWARNGQELFYLAPDGALMHVGVERSQTWAVTVPTRLIKEGYFTVPGGFLGRTYDVSPDGKRFLMIKSGGGTESTSAPTSLVVVQHFDEELKRLVPTK